MTCFGPVFTGGCLLFNVSKQAVNPGPDFGPYGLPKAATLFLVRQYALDYGNEGIRANAIAPGWHGPTRLGERYKQGLSNAEISRFEDTIIAGTPMGRRGLPDELQGLTVYLASGASSFLTGQVIVQDGGWTVT